MAMMYHRMVLIYTWQTVKSAIEFENGSHFLSKVNLGSPLFVTEQ